MLRADVHDARWYAPVDGGRFERTHFLGVPVPGLGRRVIAILTAVRAADADPFTEGDLRRAGALAACAAPMLELAQTRSNLSRRLVASALNKLDGLGPAALDDDDDDDDDDRRTPYRGMAPGPAWLHHGFWISLLAVALVVIVLSLKVVDETIDVPFVITTAPSSGDPGGGTGQQLIADSDARDGGNRSVAAPPQRHVWRRRDDTFCRTTS